MTGPVDRIERAITALIVVVLGLAFVVVGLGAAVYQIVHTHDGTPNVKLVFGFMALALLGAIMLPSVFDTAFPKVQKIYVTFFPNGLPLLGGRRRDDPPAGGEKG